MAESFTAEGSGPNVTGRYLVLFEEDESGPAMGIEALNSVAGLRAATTADFKDGVAGHRKPRGADALVFDQLSVAVVDAPPDQAAALQSASVAKTSPILAVEPEQMLYALPNFAADDAQSFRLADGAVVADEETEPGPDGVSVDYIRGFRDGVNSMANGLMSGDGAGAAFFGGPGVLRDNRTLTWGLQAVGADRTAFTGKGVRVAVLDTGMDLKHPDFKGRSIRRASFINGESVQDKHGHGTHCIGTACGSAKVRGRRYGVAPEAKIFAGKVLSNKGSGPDQSILNGINWAVRNNCQVISMSLGSRVQQGQAHSPIYELIAKRALARGSLIIAAAGNDSRRAFFVAPVSRPANCPSILAVGALDARMGIGRFSNAGLNANGGQVDIAGPGVRVFSSWPMSDRYRFLNGTSMATPHAAGIAALLAEANPSARGSDLSRLLVQGASRLSLPSRDVGAGLVEAP